MKLITKHEKEKLLHSGKGIDKPQNLTAEALFNGRTERTLSDFEWNKNAHDCHCFYSANNEFFSQCVKAKEKKKNPKKNQNLRTQKFKRFTD